MDNGLRLIYGILATVQRRAVGYYTALLQQYGTHHLQTWSVDVWPCSLNRLIIHTPRKLTKLTS